MGSSAKILGKLEKIRDFEKFMTEKRGQKKSPLSRRHTWDSSTDTEKYGFKGMKKCPAPSEEFLQALKEELEEAPEEAIEQKVWQPAISKAPIRRVRSVTFDESSLFNLHEPHVTSKKSCAPFIPTSRPLKPIIKKGNFLNC